MLRLSALLLLVPLAVQANEVNITRSLSSVDVSHNGKEMTIERNQDTENRINEAFSKTSRACPPFCIQPIKLAPGVETVAELEVLAYVEKANWGESNILLIDTRTPKWLKKGTIPSATNIPYTLLNPASGAKSTDIADIMTTQLGVEQVDELLNFSKAKTLILFCNGPWCGQSPIAIKTLLAFGYPADKLKWYRGGMQAWESFGFTTIKVEGK